MKYLVPRIVGLAPQRQDLLRLAAQIVNHRELPSRYKFEFEQYLEDARKTVFSDLIPKTNGAEAFDWFSSSKAAARRINAYRARYNELVSRHPVLDVLSIYLFEEKIDEYNSLLMNEPYL